MMTTLPRWLGVRWLVSGMLAVSLFLAGRVHADVLISDCGQVVPAREDGVLTADLVGCGGSAVRIEHHGRLVMNGHAILGSTYIAVECTERACTISGPGEIANGVYAIQQTFVGHGTPAMALFNLNIHDNSYGFISLGGKVFATNVVVNHNGTLLPNSTSSSPIGCAAHRLIGTNLQATNNGGFGITAVQLRLTDSVVTGNNGFTMGIDFSSAHRPRLVNTTCGKSLGKNGPWGVCTNDPTSPSGAFLDATGAF